MANWRYTNIQHPARIALGLTVVEYCVLDIVYQSQTHPSYTKNGWSDAGCHTIGRFLGLSSGTVKGIFDRLEKFGFMEKGVAALKRTTADFHDVAYIQNEEEIVSVQKLNVQKLNDKRSKAERSSVHMLNGKRSKAEHISKLKEVESNLKEEPQNKIEESKEQNDILAIVHDKVGETAVKVVDVIPSKAKKAKYIYPPTIQELVQPIYEKLLAKKRDHPQIVDCWNWANHQAEAFWLYQDKMGWKVEKLNSAIATWINKAIQYKTIIVPCPIQYKGNPDAQQPTRPTQPAQQERPVLTQQDIEYSQAAFAGVEQMFKQMGV